jgi:hypothetical protein
VPNWIDTLDARQRGELPGFHDANANTDEISAAEADAGVNAHAQGEGVFLDDEAGEALEYDALTVAELQAELDRRGLPTTGKKAELVERLEEADAE